MKKRSFSKKQKISMAIALAIVCGGGVALFTIAANQTQNEIVDNAENVQIYYVPDAEKVFIGGALVPYKSKDFYVSQEQGVLHSLNVKDEVYVNKGDLLYTCENLQVQSEIDVVNEQISEKKRELAREEDEINKKRIQSDINLLEGKVKKLKDKVYSYVYAPFSGKVYLNSVDSGSTSDILTLESTEYYVKAKVNEYDLFKIAIDQEVETMLYATKEKVKGKITYIGDRPISNSEGNESSLNEYEVNIEVENIKSFKNGLHVQGVALYQEENLRLPVTSIVTEGEKSFVYKIENDTYHKTEIKVIEKEADFAVISEGISQGDEILRNPNEIPNVEDGQSVYGDRGTVVTEGAN